MNHLGTETIGRRSLLNGLMTAATRSWRHGLQPNGHTSNAMVFPTITTAVNSSPTCRTPTTDSANMIEEQRRRLQQQRHQDHRLNVLWYGGDDRQQQQTPALLFESHNQYQSTDDWEKQPLRQRGRKSQRSRCRRNHKKKHSMLPTLPISWAAMLVAMYAAAMAVVYFIFGASTGSGWIWLRGIAVNNNSLLWLYHLPPTWYYIVQAFCAAIISCCCHHLCFQRQQWCCYILLALFSTTLLPSIPLAEVFSGNIKTTSLGNSITKQQPNSYNPEDFNDNRLALYEGLWQIVFFIFIAYCFVLPTSNSGLSDNTNDENINEPKKDVLINIKEDHHVTTAVLIFSIVASMGHTTLNIYTAHCWYSPQHIHRDYNSTKSMAAIQQLIANTIVLACINVTGWLIRQSVIKDRAEIIGYEGNNQFLGKYQQLRFALRRQADKLNLLLTSLLPIRVFSEMKYDIVTDAARSYNIISGSNDDNPQSKPSQQELNLQTPQLPKLYLKEYENISVVFANLTGFWNNGSAITGYGESGSQSSRQLITLIDRLMVDLFCALARSNHCLPIRLLGHRLYFVAGLPAEEGYLHDDKNPRWTLDADKHASNAVRLGLDLIDAVNTVIRDVSRHGYGRNINLNVRVGVHSGRIACGVQSFTGGIGTCSNFGSRWQYDVWGRDVNVASHIESSGRPGLVHVSRATVDKITEKEVAPNAASGSNHFPAEVKFRKKTVNPGPDFSDKDNYTFERSHEEQRNQFLRHNRIDTYFVVPSTLSPNSEFNKNPIENCGDAYITNDENHYSKHIEPLILQSIEHQLQKEEIRRQYVSIDSTQENVNTSEQLDQTTKKTGTVDIPVTTTAPVTSVKMVMNRHRRSKYFEQESLQALVTKMNTSSAIKIPMTRRSRWEDDIFGGHDSNEHEKVRGKSDDDDLFRLAKSQLMLLCVIIALFVVNVTTMPWTLLLGITFITPFVITAGELIYVMALLIDWIPRPTLHSSTYSTAIFADDDEYYHHYDSDNNDSDSSYNSDGGGRCLTRFLICHHPGSCSFLARIFKPFRSESNTTISTRSPLENNNSWKWLPVKWCRCCQCYGRHSWFTSCFDNEGVSSGVSSDDSDIESRLGFRNENAIMASTAGVSPPPPQQQQNQLQHAQPLNINTNRQRQRHRRLMRKYQDEERRTWFFWLGACSELIVVLLVCLLALLNAFTCEPVATATSNANFDDQFHVQNKIINGTGEFNTPIVNINTTQDKNHSPLTCFWPQYAVLTCCLVYVSIVITFPIYYGSLPTLRIKIGVLFVMTCVFAVAFIHFTHRHVFVAASISSQRPYNIENVNILGQQIINTTNKQWLREHDQELQHAAGLNTVIATVYAIAFAMATLICFIYKHHLLDRRAHNKVKMDREYRRLGVLRVAHRRTLHAIVPDHVANSLQKIYSDTKNVDYGRTRRELNLISADNQPIPMNHSLNRQIRERIPAYISPLYYYGYRSVVVIFATVVQSDQMLPTIIPSSENNCHYNYRQLSLFHNIFSEFDRLLDGQKFRGLVEKIKMVGTNTYMAAVGLQHQHESEHQLLMLLKEIKQRNNETSQYNNKDEKDDIDNNLANGYELYDVLSAHHVIFALDFICNMRRILYRQQSSVMTPNSCNSQFALRVGVNLGPVVAGLIGCNDSIWKRPQYDIWGNTVNVAHQMDTTGVPGSTQVTNYVVEIMKSIRNPKYEFDVRTKLINKDNKRIAYFVRENFESDESHNSIKASGSSNYSQTQHHQVSMSNKSHLQHLEPEDRLQLYKHPSTIQPSQNAYRAITQQLPRDQLHNIPVVTVHSQHSYYNAIPQQQEIRHINTEPQKSPPPPPPPRSPPPVNMRCTQHTTNYPKVQYQCSGERERNLDKRQRSRGCQLSHNIQQQNRCTPETTAKTTAIYARPLQHQQQNNNKQSSVTVVPRGLVKIFGDEPKQISPQHTPTISKSKPTCTSNHSTNETVFSTKNTPQQLQQPRRPNVLLLSNTATETAPNVSKNFDADRPLPAPPRSSDTVAGRQRHHHDPRRRRRHHNQSQMMDKHQQETQQLLARSDINNDPVVVSSAAWPSSSSFRSPISAGSFIGMSSPPSSLSSSESTDAGGTTTSNNNYNTTTTASSSDESFGRTATEDGGGIDRADIEDFDTAASSAALSPIHHRYRQQQHMLLRQWSPSTTANSSPVKRSSSFRSPLSCGDNIAVSSSSLKSPLMAGNAITTGFSGTQSLNRRRIHPTNTTSGVSNSSRRRRRRQQQQQQNNTPNTEQSISPGVPDVTSAVTATAMTSSEKSESPLPSPWKKQQQQQQQQQHRRQVTSKEQGSGCAVVGADFTDEIRRILLLDHHRGNVRQQQRGLCEGKEVQVNKHRHVKEKIYETVAKLSSSSKPQRTAVVSTTDQNLDRNIENQRNENDSKDSNINSAAIVVSQTIGITTDRENMSSTSSFEAREREITEQVRRQQAEVRRILQEHKNNVVAVVRGVTVGTNESGLHNRRRVPTTAIESLWSDDESMEPSLSLLNDGHQQRIGLSVGEYDANATLVAADNEYTTGGEGDGYTTDCDGDGYTTTGYTTDDAPPSTAGMATEMSYATAADLPNISPARQLADNLSTLNDTGLTDAEAALSDVNSMIDYNDCNENNRYRGRRQSSISSNSVCPYASDSFCDDDDDYNDDDEYFFWDGYHVENEKAGSGDDEDNIESRYNHSQFLQQQQLLLSSPSSSSPLINDANVDNNQKRLQYQSQQQTPSQVNVVNNVNNSQRPNTSAITCKASKTTTATNTTPVAENSTCNSSVVDTCAAITNANTTNTKLDEPPPSSNTKDQSNI